MHVDMDAFYASVEQRDHPEYKGRPVIVGGLSARGVVATASYEARALGVHSAMPLSQAKKRCPDGIYLWPRIPHYRAISAQIHEIMERFTPFIEPLSLDEAFLEVTGMEGLYKGPKELGQAIKRQILEETGLVVSAGIAPNKYLAKVASDYGKPDGLVIVPYGREKEFLEPMPITRLWGVGKQTAKRLEMAGFHKIRDISSLPDEHKLVPICGNQARRLWELSQGIDDRPVEYDRKVQSIGNEETYIDDIRDAAFIDGEWRYFAHRVGKRLRKANFMCNTVSIKVRYADFTTVTRQKTLDTLTDDEDTLYDVAKVLYNKLNVKAPIRLLGLTASGLQKPALQTSLFSNVESRSKLTSILDSLEAKFGEDVVVKGVLLERQQQLHSLVGKREYNEGEENEDTTSKR